MQKWPLSVCFIFSASKILFSTQSNLANANKKASTDLSRFQRCLNIFSNHSSVFQAFALTKTARKTWTKIAQISALHFAFPDIVISRSPAQTISIVLYKACIPAIYVKQRAISTFLTSDSSKSCTLKATFCVVILILTCLVRSWITQSPSWSMKTSIGREKNSNLRGEKTALNIWIFFLSLR